MTPPREPGDPQSLLGRRVLVTRAPHQASELVDRLRAAGAIPILIPTIEIAAPTSWCALDAALASLRTYDLVLFTSANAVRAFAQRAAQLSQRSGQKPGQGIVPQPRRIGVVGPATARSVEELGLAVDIIPPRYTAESLAEAVAAQVIGQQVLLIRAEVAPSVLPEALQAAGANVTIAAAYANRIPRDSIEALQKLFRADATPPDAATFTSASTAVNLVALLEAANLKLPEAVIRASIGPITSQALRELGLPPHIEATEATVAALVEALFTSPQPRSS